MAEVEGEGPVISEQQPPAYGEPLFVEPGARWYWLLMGPAAAIAIVLVQVSSGVGFDPVVPLIFLIMVSVFVGVQVKAARVHASVELTPDILRQGAEVIPLCEIVRVFPEAESGLSADAARGVETAVPQAQWTSSRAFGELSGVPRGRTPIGVQLTDQRYAQAWARQHRQLRALLVGLVEHRQ